MFCKIKPEYFYNRVTIFVIKNAICTQFWTEAVVRYYGNWKWCCSYLVCHTPIKFGHLVGNKLYFTIILTFIPIEGKSKRYKHSLIIYWTALVLYVVCIFYSLSVLVHFQNRWTTTFFWHRSMYIICVFVNLSW